MDDVRSLYQQLLILNQKAFTKRLFTTAYHVLSGAMYCAISLKDAHKLAEVEHLARTQIKELKTYFKFHQSPSDPLELSLYGSLVQIVQTRRVLFHDGGPKHDGASNIY